jgi:DNA topoisomerase-1
MSIKINSKFMWPLLSAVAFLICSLVCWNVSFYIPKVSTVAQSVPKKKHVSPLGDCEKCGKSLRKVNGRFGQFVGCSGYPECKYIQRKKASFCCPQCAGCVEERKWSGGTLWGCSNYPECRYAIFSDIQDSPCLKCDKSPYLLKKTDEDGIIILACPHAECK